LARSLGYPWTDIVSEKLAERETAKPYSADVHPGLWLFSENPINMAPFVFLSVTVFRRPLQSGSNARARAGAQAEDDRGKSRRRKSIGWMRAQWQRSKNTVDTLTVAASTSRFRQTGAGGGCFCIVGMASPPRSVSARGTGRRSATRGIIAWSAVPARLAARSDAG